MHEETITQSSLSFVLLLYKRTAQSSLSPLPPYDCWYQYRITYPDGGAGIKLTTCMILWSKREEEGAAKGIEGQRNRLQEREEEGPTTGVIVNLL